VSPESRRGPGEHRDKMVGEETAYVRAPRPEPHLLIEVVQESKHDVPVAAPGLLVYGDRRRSDPLQQVLQTSLNR
jgi:hypothetical protein